MASADIPGVGRVEINGIAEEATMRELLRTMTAMSNKNRRFDTDLAQSFKGIDRSADDITSSMNNMSSSARMASSSTTSLYNELQGQLSKSGNAVGDLGSYALTFGHDLLSTSTLISKEWAKSFNASTIADPVAVAAGTINAGLTLAGDSAGLFSNAMGRLASTVLGPFGTALGLAGADVSKLGSRVLGIINEHLAKELTLSIKTMHDFAMMGGNFAGSIDEIRQTASLSHLNLEQFAKVVKNNREELQGLGQATDLSTKRFATFMGAMDTERSNFGRTFRQELRAMGYDVEAQGDVMASYLQILRSTMSQQQFNNLQARQVAEGTREYAGNLKILAEFTGKDAKALMEKARAESMRGALMNQLDGKQKEAFHLSTAALYKLPEDIRGPVQNALMQYIAGGTITEPTIAANERMMEFVVGLAEKIKVGGTNMTDFTLKQIGVLQQQTIEYNKLTGGIESMNALFGASGIVQNLGKMNDALLAMKPIDPKEVAASRANMKSMAEAEGEVVEGYLRAQQQAQNFANFLSSLGTQLLPTYSGVIGDTVKITTEAIKIMIKSIGGSDTSRDVDRLVKNVDEAFDRIQRNIQNIPQRADGDIVNGAQLSWIGEAGPEAIIPLKNGKTIPVEFSQKTNQADPNGLIMNSKQNKDQQDNSKMVEKLPEVIASALENALKNSDDKFSTAIADLKNGLISTSKDQTNILYQQAEKLDNLVTAMQDNTRASEQIAYSMS
jgi:hypothetical protein